jgi:hypothetical protein
VSTTRFARRASLCVDVKTDCCKCANVATRLSADLNDPRLIRLLKAEASERDTTVKDVLTRALETYFAERLETKALAKLAESAFEEWNDPRDADYDRL